ncbi:PQQ-dependent sugar dehydrogenase [Altererythrobacter arenosus]
MNMIAKPSALLFPAALLATSCTASAGVDSDTASASDFAGFAIEEVGSYDRPWAGTFVPGLDVIVITEKSGKVVGHDVANGKAIFFTGVPEVDYGGQGGMGDVAFLASEASQPLSGRTIYLSYAEAGEGDTRGAAVGRGKLLCEDHQTCEIRDWQVIWRQAPKTTGRGHYSHRLLFSEDGKYLFVASGDRQKLTPAQDMSNTLGSIVRLNLDGTAAEGNPFATRDCTCEEIWTYGHRNILGMDWDAQGRLWDVEHGPAGGDELNLVKVGTNYGWPTRSYGEHYNGDPIEDHSADDGFGKPAIWWTPVIAPGDMHFYRGDMFPMFKGDAFIAGLSSNALVRVEIDGESAKEAARYDLDKRIRSVFEGPDGALWVLEDGEGGRLLRLTAK